MEGLLQVGLYSPSGEYLSSVGEMERALVGSLYRLDVEGTRANDGIAMVVTPSEAEAVRLMEERSSSPDGRWLLPSGFWMEVPVH